ncbi:MAG: HypC/HybG/HupF family hydrogenase formation chaperone [Actinomycetota bacterium]|jgi:hydrogenase expression/formation protein HypC|nr:HypC/HybG/HupF family hydrogenase formation chaperone [Actinomycetota bacterium]
MCLAIPAKVINIDGNSAQIEALGVTKIVDITLVPEAKTGDYVLVHAGFAIQIVEEDDALATQGYWEEFSSE